MPTEAYLQTRSITSELRIRMHPWLAFVPKRSSLNMRLIVREERISLLICAVNVDESLDSVFVLFFFAF